MTILVTGATGYIGSHVAQLLHQRGVAIRRLARDPTKAPALNDAPVVQGDYGDRASLDAAMHGVDTVFLVSAGAPPFKRAALHGNVIDAAAAAKDVRRIVYLSFQSASATSPFPYSADHLLSEAHLKQSGLQWTVLRDSFYLDLLRDLADEHGAIKSPDAGGKVAWVARHDVTRVAATVLAEQGDKHDGQTYTLTGPEALSLQEATLRLAALTDDDAKLHYVSESLDEGRAWRAATGAQEWEVDVWLGSYLAMGSGELSHVTHDVETVTGRKPLGLQEYLSGGR